MTPSVASESEEPDETPVTCTLTLGHQRTITITEGTLALIRHGENASFGAVIEQIKDTTATLTFTPVSAPREVPLGAILCTVDDNPATLDPSSVPRHQPEPTVSPRRRKDRG